MNIIHVFGMSNKVRSYKLVAIQYLTKRSEPDLVLINEKGETHPYGASVFYINTPENVERIKIYDDEYLKFKEYERKINSLRNNIITLKERGEKRKEKDIADETQIGEQM